MDTISDEDITEESMEEYNVSDDCSMEEEKEEYVMIDELEVRYDEDETIVELATTVELDGVGGGVII